MFSRVLYFSGHLHHPRWHYGALGILTLILTFTLSACGGLSSEPRVVSVLPTPTAVPTSAIQDVGYPTTPPDPARGAQVYAANCVRCHGPNGQGDGELVKSGSVPNPGDFTNPDKAGGQTPLAWFKTITDGRLDKLMPPWRSSLSEADRWAVALYTYTMSYKPDQIALGEKLATADALVSTGGLNRLIGQFGQQQVMVTLSDKALETQIGADSAVASLSAEQRRALVIYLRRRLLAVTGSGATPGAPATTERTAESGKSQPVATEEATKRPTTPETFTAGIVNGQITNGTAGGKVPPNLAVTLHMVDKDSKDTTLNATADANGNFAFNDVPIRSDRVYVITTRYQERVFGSDFKQGDPANKTITLPLKIYELTSAPDAIRITGLTTQINASAEGLQVAQIVRFKNTTDKLFTTDKKIGEDRYGSVTVTLPTGAAIIGFANNEERYSISQDGTTITDTTPVLPGDDHVMHVVYAMPYRDGMVIEQPINYALDGMAQLFLNPETLSASSQQLPSLGVQNQRGANYQAYGKPLTLNAGSVLSYQLRGSIAAPASASAGVLSRELIVGLLIGLGLGVILVGIVFMVRDRMVNQSGGSPAPKFDKETQQRIDQLVDQLAQLDDTYASGQLDQKSYEKRRQRLKIRLARLMESPEK